MKRFIFKTFFFFLPIVISAILFEFALRKIPNDYAQKREYLDKNSHQIETLILGSSHAYFGLDPIYFDNNTFNAAKVSQSLEYDYEIFKKYSANMLQLKSVVIPLSYFSMFDLLSQSDDGESWRNKNYFLYSGIDIGAVNLFNKTEILGQNFSINIRRFINYYLKNVSSITSTELGWGYTYKSEESKDLYITGNEAAIRHKCIIDPVIIKNIEDILNALVDYCKQRNINVLLLTLPAYQSYIEGLDSEQLNITLTIANSIAQKNENCTYINLLADSSFIARDFYDGDHLNEIGAQKLSLKVNKMLEEINEKQ